MLLHKGVYVSDRIDMDSFTEDLNIYANNCLMNYLN